MTDESNGESGFEFVDKKLEDFPSPVNTNDLIADDAKVPGITGSLITAVTSSVTVTGNILSNVAPPSALPKFITSTASKSSGSSVNISRDQIKNETMKDPSQFPAENVNDLQASSSADETTQESDALESPKIDTGALAESLFTWVKDTVANSNVLSKVAEKAKNSVNSMITTLDPQMREFIYSGGDIEIIVASDKEDKITPIREAFQNVFGNATVNGMKVETEFDAIQPVGFTAAIKAAQQRITATRSNPSTPHDIPIIAIENFLLEIGQNTWYDLGVIILEDIKQKINLQTFTQMTPVPSQIVKTAQESTPINYSSNGFSVSIGSLMGTNLQVPHTEWHTALTGVSRKDIIFLAAQSLAGIYKNTKYSA